MKGAGSRNDLVGFGNHARVVLHRQVNPGFERNGRIPVRTGGIEVSGAVVHGRLLSAKFRSERICAYTSATVLRARQVRLATAL